MIEGDSKDYEVLEEAVELSNPESKGLTCEIGLRRGYGSAVMMEVLSKKDTDFKVHLAVDPYGNIPYMSHDNRLVRLDYTNSMKNETLPYMYKLSDSLKVEFLFFNLTDDDFFHSTYNGVPVYLEDRYLINRYTCVHLDGPHSVPDLLKEIIFFSARMESKSTLVIDDVEYFDFELLHSFMGKIGWKLHKITDTKALFIRL